MTTFVLVPGAGGTGALWHPVADELRAHGHDAVPVDLPADDPAQGFAEYAQGVVDAAAGRAGLVLVAQSLAGFVVPGVYARIPDAVRVIVLVNAMIPAPGETAGQWGEATGSEAARRANDLREGRDPDAPFSFETYLLHDVSAAALAALGPPRDQAETVFGQTAEFGQVVEFGQTAESAGWPPVPTHVLVGQDDRLFPAEFQRRVALSRLGITADLVPGGHLAAVSHPVEVAGRLLAYATPPSLGEPS